MSGEAEAGRGRQTRRRRGGKRERRRGSDVMLTGGVENKLVRVVCKLSQISH